ncbi:MAG: glycoside hydrolase [Verrucomicrobiota bacterium]|nr:glycoside hydrolase [Verrucomicrobiota bacterium]
MKKRTTSEAAFFNLRWSAGLALVLCGVFLALVGLGQLPAHAQQGNKSIVNSTSPLVPAGFDCAQFRALHYDKQENLAAGAIAIYCGEAQGGSPTVSGNSFPFVQEILAPLLGTADVDLITGTEINPHTTQSETFVAANPDNPQEIVVAYNDSRGVASNPINISGASVSTDGGNTFTRLTRSTGQSPFANTFGDPVVLYNRPTGTWFTVWLDAACGGQGLGGYKSTTPANADSWTHFCVHNNSADDRESGWTDNNPSSPFYGRMYITWNDFNRGGGAIFVRYSTDNGLTWTNERQITTGFFRNVQLTGDEAGNLYLASMNEMGGGLTNRSNLLYRSTDGGNSWTQSYSGPTFAGPGTTTCASNSYFACMFNGPSFWRHMGWGQPAAQNGVVSYVYDARNTSNGDSANVFYIRSTDNGSTFSAPFQLNTDSTTRPQWQPNISVGAGGSLVAVWYDGREFTTCSKGNTAVPCYRMWSRKSTDNGATWGPDEAFSDVASPLPGQPDPNIVTEYAGDYDYSFASPEAHIHTWTDGRVAINNAAQQDAFVDREAIGGGGGTITLETRLRQREGSSQVSLRWTPADGGNMNVLRNGAVVQTTADDGKTKDTLGTQTGTFTYQVCETDSGDCSNEVQVNVP